jgi:hypothetical protein
MIRDNQSIDPAQRRILIDRSLKFIDGQTESSYLLCFPSSHLV